jgi:predicted PurR-regulated permease PerM
MVGRLERAGRASWSVVGIAAVIALVILLVAITRSVSVPLLIAFVAGVVFNPLVDVLAARMSRVLAAALVMLLIIVVGLGVIVLVIWAVSEQGDEIADGIRDGVAQLQDWLEGVVGADRLEEARQSVESLGDVGRDGAAAWIVEQLGSVSAIVAGVGLGLFLLFFILSDYATIERWLVRTLSGGKNLARAQRISDDANRTLQRYFRGQTIIALADAVAIGIGAFAIGVPLPLTIAVVVFFFAYIPYLGAFLSGALAVLLALSTGELWRAIAMLAIFLVLNTVIDNLLSPKVQSAEIGLHPLALLVAVAIGGGAFGIVGAILAAPFTAIGVKIVGVLSGEDSETSSGSSAAMAGGSRADPPPSNL